MKTYNFCKRMDAPHKILLYKWARRLEADEMTIHKDGSVTLMCSDVCICERYYPSAKELYKEGDNNMDYKDMSKKELIYLVQKYEYYLFEIIKASECKLPEELKDYYKKYDISEYVYRAGKMSGLAKGALGMYDLEDYYENLDNMGN